jgi:RHH-type proline utilization regulon transcriptional repressor/proline dehydrogenase/delta 1-pyrroline-5-carboxylate dehydrogenase
MRQELTSGVFENSPLTAKIHSIGTRLIELAREEEARLAKRHFWEAALLDWCMKNPELRTRVFRFIDVFPQLEGARAVVSHLREYFPLNEYRLPHALRTALLITYPDFLTRGAIHVATRFLYARVARLFVGAHDEGSMLKQVEALEQEGMLCSLDLLGERTASEEEAEEYLSRYRRLIHALGSQRKGCRKQNISVKASALDPYFDPADPEGASRRVRGRLREILRLARKEDVFVHIDMEEYVVRDLTLKVVRDLLEEEEFRGGVKVGIVLQAYLRDAEAALDRVLAWAAVLPEPITIRLVRGAYWDQEIMRAREFRWPVPVFTRKVQTDAMYERLTERLIGLAPKVRVAIATHNIRSIAHAMAVAEEKGLGGDEFEFQILYGLGAPLQRALAEMGFAPRVYLPVGDPVWGMAYLVRRLLENVSSQSFVRRGIHEHQDPEGLLRAPEASSLGQPEFPAGGAAEKGLPPLEFFREDVREKFRSAVDHARASHHDIEIPAVIGGKSLSRSERIRAVSPNDGKTMVADASRATEHDASEAVQAAYGKWRSWNEMRVSERAECLRKAARWMTDRRYELAALEVHEVGKPWREADADVKEAVDYLYFYARVAEESLGDSVTENLDDETNFLRPRGRGVAAVIAPWNFPLAILTGMSAACLVTGNTVILKPAEQALRSGWKVFEAYREAGIPAGVVNFLPGYGAEAGAALVNDSRVAMVAFTGSREVGLGIARAANAPAAGMSHLKKYVIEMGGKNAAIVDETADLDLALPAILDSAFGYAGQKCSALSRLIVLDSIYDFFLSRFLPAVASFPVGSAYDAGTRCGPLIDGEALARVQAAVAEGKSTGFLLGEGKAPSGEGFFVAPSVFGELPAGSRLLEEEIFGPVLAVIRAKSFREALAIANRTPYGLTGGIFSRTPSNIEAAKRDMEVGNLYINRPITGAIVGRHPFGGYRLSGTGTKAGSADYLREFYLERTISENISRHGFAPLREPETETP